MIDGVRANEFSAPLDSDDCDHGSWVRIVGESWNEGMVKIVCAGCGWAPLRPFPERERRDAVTRLAAVAGTGD